ncbi:branched-chain amino acid ABC transporter [Secundilactobacillus pentosiphilus]|uniref:Branched-chain amino acid ABC transporter n=1 Tax=Secundilactobacillus pentosiphilus TaxID=1714682 RepID=A0A1Z5IRJ2_9LACO|nr:AzlD domain-containing protein [Secundilactobacillus pentosiphilus]GAX04377.1 branched-chain amino acid ABC transporter [Secundilactobacillus pentosiphilus]GAX05663.1 branched-chain amino acid ABC transporter [Secundilactobacillus pentosiphilus]
MSLSSYVLLVILGSGLVTWLSRVVPFVLLKEFKLPAIVVNFLGFVPICIMSALWMESLFIQHLGQLPSLNVPNILASVPTLISAVISKNLLVIVIVGVISLAVINVLG